MDEEERGRDVETSLHDAHVTRYLISQLHNWHVRLYWRFLGWLNRERGRPLSSDLCYEWANWEENGWPSWFCKMKKKRKDNE